MRSLLRWGRPVMAVAVLAAVIWRLGSGPFLDGVRALDGRALLAASIIFLVTTTCCAWRWKIVASGLGVRLSLPAAVAAYYRGLFLNLTLPGGIAGDIHRGVRHGRDVQNVSHALRAVIWERTAGQIVQIALTICVLFILPSPLRSEMPFVAAAVAALVIVVLLVIRMRPRGGSARFERARRGVVGDIRAGLLRKDEWPAIVLLSIAAVLGHALTFLIAARVVGTPAPISRLLPLAFISMMAMVLPSISGWGPREGVTAWAFAAAGLGANRGAATAVAYGVMVLAASLPGGLVLVAGWLSRRRGTATRVHTPVPDTKYAR